MPLCVKEADVQREVSLVLFIMAGKHVKGVSIKIGVKVTVPPPGSIRVREMARAGTIVYAVSRTIADPVPAGTGMGMDTGAVTRYRDAARGNKPQFHGRNNGSNGKQFLECFFVIKGEISSGQGIISHFLSNSGMPVGKFFILAGF